MHINRRKLLLLSLVVLFCLLFGGCTAAKKPTPAPDPSPKENISNTGRDVVDPEKNPYQTQPISNDQALKISREVDDVPGVVKATVIVSNNNAYIGVYTDSNRTVNEADIKQQVVSTVKSNNPSIQTVYVSTDPNTISRLNKINRGIATGDKSSNSYSTDTLKQLFRE